MADKNSPVMTVIEILPQRIEPVTKKEEQDTLYYIDIGIGIEYSGGDREMYLEFLAMFYEMKEDNDKRISESFDAGDWYSYVTQIHALKSTSLTVGAVELSEQAKTLELAGKEFLKSDNQDVPGYILAHHEDVMKLYDSTYKEVGQWLKKNGYSS